MPLESTATPQRRKISRYLAALILLFVLTLPLVNPWVRGDGVGYYAYARSLLIEHKFDFTQDWLRANASFRMGRLDANGRIDPSQYTPTGHLNNHFSIGPAILWSPFLIAAHAGVLTADRLGARIPADGFSRPYTLAMAFGTALYGFLAVAISFCIARQFVPELWAFIAAVAVWFASSLPVYMYFNPSWSHAQSAFTVALFVWFWLRTRGADRFYQWVILGALGGLMVDVYYPNALLLLLPLGDSVSRYWSEWRDARAANAGQLLGRNLSFTAAFVATVSPTLITRKIVYGSYFHTGYERLWNWSCPALLRAMFSADHGLFSWTPVVVLSLAGLFLLCRYDRALSAYFIAIFAAFLYLIGCYADWDGLASFGNRFFISLTPLFIIGLAALFDSLATGLGHKRTAILAGAGTAILVLWNLGLIFQWGMHLIPPRGPISWRDAAYNQVAVVPEEAASAMDAYFTRRSKLMQHIERTDVKELKSQQEQSAE